MTAYLQRGGKIHLNVPLDWSQKLIREALKEYQNLGITVFLVTSPAQACQVVSVIRGRTKPHGSGHPAPWQDL